MGKYSIYVIRGLKIKRDHTTRRVTIQGTIHVLSRTQANKSTHSLLVEMQTSTTTLKDTLKVFIKLKIVLAFDTCLLLLFQMS